ncbi:type III secretion system chaperone [Palleronia sediminis]|nr:alpha/beta-hydrolase family protein [Palleronia sediminis]
MRSHLEKAIESLGDRLGLELRLDGEGRAAVALDDVEIAMIYVQPSDEVQFYSPIGRVPEHGAETFLRILLSSNYMGRLTGRCALAVDPDASEAEADWGAMRIVFLQYASDPIVFYDPASLWRAPPWMNDPPAADASGHLRFMPIVTQFQLALDMALAFGAPPGHGHAYYAQDYIAPWVEVTAPENWTEADTARLKVHCDNGVKMGCDNG